MIFAKRKALNRISFLLPEMEYELEERFHLKPNNCIGSKYLELAEIKLNPILFFILVLIIDFFICFLLSKFVSLIILPIIFIGFLFLTYLILERRIEARAQSFAGDYPTVLLATASSIKAGLTPYAALERSVNLLPQESLVRFEVSKLLQKIRKGNSKERALFEFASSIRQPDVELFREAFLIVLEHGGRFTPTLERLASVCRDRSSLIRSARVSTASMRMTANVLLCVAPLVLGLVAVRTKNFWEIFFTNNLANLLGSIGVIVILLSYGFLIKMSNFRP